MMHKKLSLEPLAVTCLLIKFLQAVCSFSITLAFGLVILFTKGVTVIGRYSCFLLLIHY